MFCVVWLLMVTVLSFMATIYLQLRFGCDSVDYSSSAGECFSVAFERECVACTDTQESHAACQLSIAFSSLT